MKNGKLWTFRLSTAVLTLIPAAVGVNCVGKFIAETLKLPLWLDSIGTMLAAFLAGPVAGALVGVLTNVIYGITDPVAFVYAVTNAGIGITAGLLARLGYMNRGFGKGWLRVLIMGLVVGLVAAVVSTPLNLIFWEGQTGNVWGDALFGYILNATDNTVSASLLDEIVVDLPDKIVSVLAATLIFKSLPNSLLSFYKVNGEIERL